MELRETLEFLENDKHYLKWRKTHKKDYFSYAFKTFMDGRDDEWQLGFYSKKDDSLTTFVIWNNKVSIREGEEVFKKAGMEVPQISLKDFKIPLREAIKKVNEFKEKKYPKEKSMKIIAVLQNLKDFGLVWNMTFITETLNVLNMKIDASNCNIVREKLEPIISFKQN